MKKLILLSALVVISLTQLSAQKSTFEKGDRVLNLGIGLGSGYYSSYYSSHMPAISASFEVGVKDGVIEKGSIGVGGYLGFSSAKFENYWRTSNLVIGGRGSLHYPLVDKLDTYTGLILGYVLSNTTRYSNYSGIPHDYRGSGIAFAWYAGARYYFSEKFAGMAELGVGVAYLNLGIALKL